MQFGGKMNMGNLGQDDTTRMVKFALDNGINFVDTADVYSLGESETQIGNALKGIRQEIVLATKVRLPMGGNSNFNHSGATRVNIKMCIRDSQRTGRRRRLALVARRLSRGHEFFNQRQFNHSRRSL